eukprot:15360574-Ditylum_brightwellii.AAC.1
MLEEVIVDSQRQYHFGKEVAIMQNWIFQNCHLNKLLKAVLFGIGFEKINPEWSHVNRKGVECCTPVLQKFVMRKNDN